MSEIAIHVIPTFRLLNHLMCVMLSVPSASLGSQVMERCGTSCPIEYCLHVCSSRARNILLDCAESQLD